MPSTRIAPSADVVEAADQVDERGLARPAGPDQADHLAGPDRQVHVFAARAGCRSGSRRRGTRLRPRSRPGWTGWTGSATLGTRSRMAKIRCALAAARCTAATMRLIESIRP